LVVRKAEIEELAHEQKKENWPHRFALEPVKREKILLLKKNGIQLIGEKKKMARNRIGGDG